MVEQRYRVVLEVGSGVPVAEVAGRYGVSRQSVHTWLVRYRQEGVAGLEDCSHRVHHHPWRIPAEIEELICELRHGHPKWGPRRLVFAGWCCRCASRPRVDCDSGARKG